MDDNQRNDSLGGLFRGFLLGLIAAGVVFLAAMLFYLGATKSGGSEASVLRSPETLSKLAEVENLICTRYLYEPDPKELEEYMFVGIAAGLNDPYSDYIPEDRMKDFQRSNEGSYKGVGITITDDEKSIYPLVYSVYEGSPAWECGIRSGDHLAAIDGEDLAGVLYHEAADRISPEAGSVEITVLRDEERLTFTVTPREIAIAPVRWEMMEDEIAYLRIPEFDTVTVPQFEEAIGELLEQGARGVIIDVRDNPGGLLDSVCSILDDLLGECALVYSLDRAGNEETIYSDEKTILTRELPMAVLVNSESASAAEVFSGDLQDYGLASLIGTTTYGKGVIQTTYILKDGSAFKLTTGKYLTGGRRDIHESGIEPDIVIEDADGQLETALEYIRGKLEEAAAEETEPESGEKVMPDEAEPESGEKVMPEETERKLHG